MQGLSRVFTDSPKVAPSGKEPIVRVYAGSPTSDKELIVDDIVVTNPDSIVEDRSIDEARPLRIVVIGAGISGILACIRFTQRIPNVDIVLYEKNPDIGGTWFENKYPGCACDIPAHTYQATFEPNKEWSTFYAAAPEIHAYWKKVAAKYGCMKHIKLKQKVSGVEWNEETAKWSLQVEDSDSGKIYDDKADILIQATGALNNWAWPSIPGLHDFKGKLMHSARWEDDFDYSGLNVAIIGNGSSGIQIVPGMLPKVTHIDHYVRSKTWIAPTFAREQIEKRQKGKDNFAFTAEEIEEFKTDKNAYLAFRKEVELELQSIHGATMNGHPMQLEAHDFFVENMRRRLTIKPEMLDGLIPSFAPACRRLTPGPGYLEALTHEKVDLISNDIVKVDETGIFTKDGKHRPVDMIVCATGFDTTCTPRFPIKGRNGLLLSERWEKTPETYISVATDEFPNYFISLGPNAGLGEGSLLLVIEKEIDYFTQCVAKMQRDNIRTMTVRKEAVTRFTKYCDDYFKKTVFSGNCRSWYKGGSAEGRITALWPGKFQYTDADLNFMNASNIYLSTGSSLHAIQAFKNPRWEDFEYSYFNDNPAGWLGDGWTENEKNNKINVDYLNDDRIDFPTPVTSNL
ncbi:hypothetical protein N7495_007780 [Penicillium taxi]|uniref:uncharacterized protein n=1 Tax=Penicillium taxi TaxID=168475 RepID=UPI00254514A9|nr:uncharacterized protein N7495_007780 [Penicillium taxi]KAJ5887739.1 hypothetical protein N7495_007780 [Penicillium taxi]